MLRQTPQASEFSSRPVVTYGAVLPRHQHRLPPNCNLPSWAEPGVHLIPARETHAEDRDGERATSRDPDRTTSDEPIPGACLSQKQGTPGEQPRGSLAATDTMTNAQACARKLSGQRGSPGSRDACSSPQGCRGRAWRPIGCSTTGDPGATGATIGQEVGVVVNADPASKGDWAVCGHAM
ncbi:hypothetical protein VTI74DRAFT_11614 [Chaetomium olivicolor]